MSDFGRIWRRRGPWASALASTAALGLFGLTGAPYYRIGPGPVVGVGPFGAGSWSVTTVRVTDTNWFQWTAARLSGGRIVKAAAAPSSAQREAMDQAQVGATIVAAQLAARRVPTGWAGLQVRATPAAASATPATPAATSGTSAASARLRAGDILLAAGDAAALTPLRTAADITAVTARSRRQVRVLTVPKVSTDSWGAAEIRMVTPAVLAGLDLSPAPSATAYPLGEVQGSSAGLILALARLDALTGGDLTGGRRIAGTGAIGFDGTVTTVGEVAEKVKAARSARAGVFFVPAFQREQAARAARGSALAVVPVGSVSQAVRWLCAHGSDAAVC